MKKIFLIGLTALSMLTISANAREYKCTDKDVIIAGLKANPSDRGISIPERLRVLHGFRPWKIENIEQRGFTPKTMIGCMADTNGAYITYVIHIDKDTGKAYVLRSPARSQKTFKNSIKHGVSVEVK
ncbi:hypothetical protein [Campylobacter concisus]|jgi:hypothetical protein|uniref:hypothetical protein n=1 Tax=Campylobacter concisus TaxID=199 RepID=UPI000CD8FFDD|nr:hypothetical protein [Campylobacter concisus]